MPYTNAASLSGNITGFTYGEVPGSHCCLNCHPEELALAVIELAEYEHRGEAYATERLWERSPRYVLGREEMHR